MGEVRPLELLQQLTERVLLLERRFAVIENNTKEILARLNEVLIKKPQPKISAPIEKPKEDGTKLTQVIGKIRNKENRLLCSVRVTVFDENGGLVKDVRTNRSGEWLCYLSPGKYSVKYFLENVVDVSLNFQVVKDQKILRLAQPV